MGMSDRDEKLINQLHVIALMIGRGQKHVNLREHLLAQEDLSRAKDFVQATMEFIRGR